MLRHFFKLIVLLICYCNILTAQRLPTLIPYHDGDKWGYSDSNGKIVIPAQWTYEAGFFKNGKAITYNIHQPFNIACLINESGDYIIPPSRNWTGWWNDTEYRLNTYDTLGNWGMVDTNNNLLIPYSYHIPGQKSEYNESPESQYFYHKQREGLNYFSKEWNTHFLIIKKGGKDGVIDEHNNIRIPFKYRELEAPEANASYTYFLFKTDSADKWGAIDANGKVIVPPLYDGLRHINYNKYDIFPPDPTQNFNKEGFLLFSNEKQGWQDYPGKLFIPTLYHGLDMYPDSTAIVKLYEKQGLYNKNGKLIVPVKYTGIQKRGDSAICTNYSNINDSISLVVQTIINVRTGKKKISRSLSLSGMSIVMPSDNFEGHRFDPRVSGFSESPYMNWRGQRIYAFYKDGHLFKIESYVDGGRLAVVSTKQIDSPNIYYAIVDTGLSFIIAPQVKYHFLFWSEPRNNILVVQYRKRYGIVDTNFNILAPFQKEPITRFIKVGNKVYGLAKDTLDYFKIVTGNVDEDRLLQHIAIGRPLYGYFEKGYSNFTGQYYLAIDEKHRQGIIDSNGNVVFPHVSFKHVYMQPLMPGLIKVSNDPYALVTDNPYCYLVNENNHPLFSSDALVFNTSGNCIPLCWFPYKTQKGHFSQMYFYVNKRGLVYARDPQ